MPTYASGGCKQQEPWKSELLRSCCCVRESLQTTPPSWGWAGATPGVAQGGPGSLWLWLHPRVVPWGLEAFPWYRRGCQVWCPSPAPCQAVPVLCPWAGAPPGAPPVVMGPSAGMHTGRGPGMKESAGKTQIVEKKPQPPKNPNNP